MNNLEVCVMLDIHNGGVRANRPAPRKKHTGEWIAPLPRKA